MPVHDADGAVAELAASQHGALARSQAADCGLSPRMVRSRIAAGVFVPRFPGVLTIAVSPPTWRQDLSAATLTRPGVVTVSVRAAAGLHGLDGFPEGPLQVHTGPDTRLRLPGVDIHRVAALDRQDIHRIDGIPVTSLARTLADLGSFVDADLVERALDDARRRGVSLRWIRTTAERLRRRGQAGPTTLLRLLDDIDPHQRARDSWFEALVERCLRSSVLPQLVRQHEVRDPDDQFVARLDVAFPPIKLGIEAHSRMHHFGNRAEPVDERRDNRLAALGWEVLYVGWQDTRSPELMLRTVEAVARTRCLVDP